MGRGVIVNDLASTEIADLVPKFIYFSLSLNYRIVVRSQKVLHTTWSNYNDRYVTDEPNM